ncbi:MAG: DUF1343 domain-containing protein [Paludibacteraceae bacterium]|nr:DUF1343 domain-containing protein [Paludibacteraceae bacterium]
MRSKFFLTIFLFLIVASGVVSAKTEASNDRVYTGIEVLREQNFEILKGKRVGLLTNATGVDAELKSTIDILHESENVNLVALFAPEHGVRGDVYAGGTVSSSKDTRTGLPVRSLYGKTKRPTAEMLKDIDVMVYDIQDIGSRSYTFISSMGKVMDACGEYGKEVVVLDRPNPLGGNRVEGPLVSEGYFSFISQFSIPYIYGLTCGELANLLNEEGHIKHRCKVTVVEMKNWKRDMSFEDTGLPWVLTSPAIPTSDSPYFYPLSGIVGELNALSIGVGYTLPFQTFAAPWINADSLAMNMNSLRLEGIKFRPIVYKPFSAIYANKVVGGVQVYVTDKIKARLTEVQFHIIAVLQKMYPDKDLFTIGNLKTIKTIDNVCGNADVRKALQEGNIDKTLSVWRKDEDNFIKLSKKYHLYK